MAWSFAVGTGAAVVVAADTVVDVADPVVPVAFVPGVLVEQPASVAATTNPDNTSLTGVRRPLRSCAYMWGG